MSLHISYQHHHPLQRTLEQRLDLLQRLFSQLLVHTDGDAQQALDILQRLGERHGLFDDDLTIEDFTRTLERNRLIMASPNGHQLSPKGEAFVRRSTLDQIFSKLSPGAIGNHRIARSGLGGERLDETRPWIYGDDLHHIDFNRSYHNALRRSGGTLALSEDDLEVYETERNTTMATALLLDISHSMVLYGEDRITPAKRVALALAELIRSRYPKDALHLILFGDEAYEISLKDLTYAGVGPYHTNTHAALQMARRILMRKKHANKQIVMITDGKPTALTKSDGIYINSGGLDREIITATLNEAAACRRNHIPITTVMIARDPYLVRFVEDLTRINHGRAFYAGLEGLEQAVFVDFMSNRRQRRRR